MLNDCFYKYHNVFTILQLCYYLSLLFLADIQRFLAL